MLEKVMPLIEAPWAGASTILPAAAIEFRDFWQESFAKEVEPLAGWPSAVDACLKWQPTDVAGTDSKDEPDENVPVQPKARDDPDTTPITAGSAPIEALNESESAPINPESNLEQTSTNKLPTEFTFTGLGPAFVRELNIPPELSKKLPTQTPNVASTPRRAPRELSSMAIPPRPQKASVCSSTNAFIARGSPKSPLSSTRHMPKTPRRSPMKPFGLAAQGNSGKENIPPLPVVESVVERIARTPPTKPSVSVLGKHSLPHDYHEIPAKRSRTFPPASDKEDEDEVVGTLTQDSPSSTMPTLNNTSVLRPIKPLPSGKGSKLDPALPTKRPVLRQLNITQATLDPKTPLTGLPLKRYRMEETDVWIQPRHSQRMRFDSSMFIYSSRLKFYSNISQIKGCYRLLNLYQNSQVMITLIWGKSLQVVLYPQNSAEHSLKQIHPVMIPLGPVLRVKLLVVI